MTPGDSMREIAAGRPRSVIARFFSNIFDCNRLLTWTALLD
jgi:hypothetical protein